MAATTKLSPAQKMAAARALVRERAPYFRAALFGAIYKMVPSGTLNTMGMTEHGVLLWDPADVEQLTVDEVGASILHELLHWLRDHAKRCRAIAAHPRVWNYAADMEINDDIRDMGMTLPSGAKACVFAASIGERDGLTAELYYSKVRQQVQQQGGPGQGDGSGDGIDVSGHPDFPSPNGKASGLGNGKCGGCSGNPSPGEAEHDKDGKGSGDAKKNASGQAEGSGGRSEAEVDRIRKQVAEAAVKHASQKGRGSVPGGFLTWAEDQIKPPKIDWRSKLAKVMRSSMAYRPGAIVTSWQRFGRKQAALGFGMGKPMTPSWRNPVPRVMVAVDTSGSMGTSELERAASEVGGILKAINSEVEFTACDCAVHATKTVKTWQDAVKEFKGGGGTSFIPVFEHIKTRRNQLAPEVLIFITDGGGPAPDHPPTGLRVVWVLVGRHRMKPFTSAGPLSWGEVVMVDEED